MASRQALSKMIFVVLASILAGCAGVVSNPSGGTPDMPVIAAQPTSQTVTTGQAATFGVTANGTAPLGYQWRKNSTNIGGATAATYTTPATTASDNGMKFDVVVSNAKGSVTSSAAALTVTAAAVAPTITTQPAGKTVTAGQTATFTVAATGTAPLSYQWQKNGSAISGAIASTYTTPATTASDSGSSFTVVVTNSKGSVASAGATLTVTAAPVAPTVTTQPANMTVTAGQTATFSVAASGTAPLTYQWKKNGTNIAGAISSSYTTPATTTGDSGSSFAVTVTNSAGSVTSNAAVLTVNPAPAVPAITAQPSSQTVTAGQTATFSVAASGTAPLTYQWKKNGTNIAGAISSSYTTPATTTGDSGSSFAVTVTNSAGSVTSSGATLTVTAAPVAPTVTTQPANMTVTAGQTATFSVAASGTAPLTYQWKKNGTNIAGAISSSYTTPATTTGDSGSSFAVTVTNSARSVTSNAAVLTVNPAPAVPAITAQPSSQTVTAGQTATFSVAASGTAPLTYQWKKNGTNIAGAISSSYTTPATTTGDSGSSFAVTATNSAGSVTSSGATLTVTAAPVAPTVTTQPANMTVTAGQTATFSVAASGTAPLTYQWKKNGTNIAGATGSTYTTPATATADSGSSFTVVVNNTAGSVTSGPATLTVNAAAVAPTITSQPSSITVTAGQTATFSVTAAGTAPLGYQWKKNGTAIGGATSSTYTTPATTTADSGAVFNVVISNTAGSVTSGPATLTVNAVAVAPTITSQPSSITVTAGQTATFSVTAAGTAPLGYQWKKNGTAIGGATSSTYTTPATTTADSGAVFNVVISNTAGSITSGPATLTVNAAAVAPTITSQPSSITVTAGQTATFSVTAAGTAPLGYQWKKNGTAIGGATSSTYTTPATTTADSGAVFNVVISNTAGSVTSGPATLTVNAAAVAPTITSQPSSITVTAGQTATFSVTAAGTAPLGYQWKKNGTAIGGATSSTYTTPATTTADSGAVFNVVISNTAGSVTSGPATLTVNAAAVAPTITSQPSSITVTAGQTATFTVVAAGTGPLTYQWQKNGMNISGATTASYTTPATVTSDSGSVFLVVVSNSVGSVSSNSVALTVNLATQKTYSTNFPLTESPISEGGNWIGGLSAGGTLWGNVRTSGNMAFGVSEPTQFGDPTAILTGTWSPEQSVTGVVKINTTPTGTCCHEIELRLRMSIGQDSITGYEAYCSVMPDNAYCHIARWNGPNGSYCNIESSAPNMFAVNGDVLMATATGTNPTIITMYKNGTMIMQATDSGQGCSTGGAAGPFTAGSPGIGFYDNQDNNWNTFGFSSFSAQENVSGAAVASSSMINTTETTGAVAANNQDSMSDSAVATGTLQPNVINHPAAGNFLRLSAVSIGPVDSHSNKAAPAVYQGAQKTYWTSFPYRENPISEKGNWINGRSTGLDWFNMRGASYVAFGTESGLTPDSDSFAVLSGAWSPVQMAQATVYAMNHLENSSGEAELELLLRTSVITYSVTGYIFKFRVTSDGSQSVQIVRRNGSLGDLTQLGNQRVPSLQDGDVIKATAIGNTLTAYVNGTTILSVIDSMYSTGSPGVGFYKENAATSNNNEAVGVKNFFAADYKEAALPRLSKAYTTE